MSEFDTLNMRTDAEAAVFDQRPTLDEQQPPTPQAERPFQDFSVVDKPENRIEYPHPDDLRGAPHEDLSAGAVKCPICQHRFEPGKE